MLATATLINMSFEKIVVQNQRDQTLIGKNLKGNDGMFQLLLLGRR